MKLQNRETARMMTARLLWKHKQNSERRAQKLAQHLSMFYRHLLYCNDGFVIVQTRLEQILLLLCKPTSYLISPIYYI